MSSLIQRLAHSYDKVIFDSSPLLPVTDAAILSRITGGTVVVVGADRVHKPQLRTALASLEAAGAQVLGIVLNKVDKRQAGNYGYYYDSYAPVEKIDRGQIPEIELAPELVSTAYQPMREQVSEPR
jgi:Mrp family chromosome partitioning ATPase